LKIRYSLIIGVLISSISAAFAQNDGPANTGMAFLKLGVTSSAISLGEAVVSNVDDAAATFYNPAALFNGEGVNALFMHNQSVLGIRTEFLGAKVRMNKIALGLSVNNTAVTDIQIRDIPGPALGTFDAQNFAIGLSAAYKVNAMLQFGVTAKFLYQKIYIDNNSGYAFDIGGLYNAGKYSIGASISNFGKMSVLRNDPTVLPTSFRAGGSYNFDLSSISSTVRVSADAYKVFDGGILHANTGAQFLYKDFLAIRVGYQTGFDDRSLTTGVGIRYKGFNLDYAFVPYKYSFGNSNTFTLGASF